MSIYDEPLVLADDRAFALWSRASEQGTRVERALGSSVLTFLQRLGVLFDLERLIADVINNVTDDLMEYVDRGELVLASTDIADALADAHDEGMRLDEPDEDLSPRPRPRVPDGPPRPPSQFVTTASLPGPGVDTSTRRGEAWARRHAATLVTDVTSGQRDVIRDSVAESLRLSEGLPGLESRLRNAGLGLTSRDQQAVMRYERRLLADGVPPGTARALSSQYATRMLNTRAMTIARTETFTALNRGRVDLWSDAIKRGDLPATARKVWVTAMDERVCPYCRPLDGLTAPVAEPFDIDPSRHTEGDLDHPPLHPNCRCLIMLNVE